MPAIKEAQRVLLPFSHRPVQKVAKSRKAAFMSDKNQNAKIQMARQFMAAIPHARDLGMELTELEGGVATITMPYDERLIGDPETGILHGGAVAALMDSCCGAAVMCHLSNPGGTATIDLRVDYMRSATPGQALSTTATCYHITRSVAFVRATAVDEDTQNPVAMATGTFTVEGGRT
jgi:uncharacterized protein (TIGR00369 family)